MKDLVVLITPVPKQGFCLTWYHFIHPNEKQGICLTWYGGQAAKARIDFQLTFGSVILDVCVSSNNEMYTVLGLTEKFLHDSIYVALRIDCTVVYLAAVQEFLQQQYF